jgi:ribose transport system permease protein
VSEIFKKYGTLIALFGIIILFSILKPSVFFTLRNFINITQQISILMITAIGATFILGVSEFDLSLASTVSFGGVVAAGLMSSGLNWVLAIIISLSFSLIFGVMNGFLVSKLKLPSFVTTLATGTLLGGITFWYSKGTIIFSGIPDDFLIMGQNELLGIPITSLIMFGISIVSWYILSKTIFGRALYSTGGNETAAKYSGIKVNKVKIIAFATSGVLSGFAGILLASKLGSAHPTAGGGYLMSAYAAAFLGTTLFKEGEANVWGTLIGALIMGIMANGLTIMNTPYFLQDIITGIIIVTALILRVSKKA